MEISETNPDGCRPHLQYPWHADGPSVEVKEEVNTAGANGNTTGSTTVTKKEDIEDIEKVHEVWWRYIDRIKQNSNASMNIVVILVTCLIRNSVNAQCLLLQAKCVRSSSTKNATAPKSSRN